MLDFSPSFIIYAPKYAPKPTALHSEPTSIAAAQFPKNHPYRRTRAQDTRTAKRWLSNAVYQNLLQASACRTRVIGKQLRVHRRLNCTDRGFGGVPPKSVSYLQIPWQLPCSVAG